MELRERLPGDLGDESGWGPDPDSRPADQDGVRRVSLHESFNFDRDLVTLPAQRDELFGDFGQQNTVSRSCRSPRPFCSPKA